MLLRRVRQICFVLLTGFFCTDALQTHSRVTYRKLQALRHAYHDMQDRIENQLRDAHVVEEFLTFTGDRLSSAPRQRAVQLITSVASSVVDVYEPSRIPSMASYSSFLQTGPRSANVHESEDQLDGQHFDPEDATAEPTFECKKNVFGLVAGTGSDDPACMMGETNQQ